MIGLFILKLNLRNARPPRTGSRAADGLNANAVLQCTVSLVVEPAV